ncbi:MAG TPA: hypothetical protein VMV69_18445 [Pirellulales bacterium]|nr:hypothetical protein [Pirellulales bacterium]
MTLVPTLRVGTRIVALFLAIASASTLRADDLPTSDPLATTPTVQAPSAHEVKARALAWLADRKADDATLALADAAWNGASATDAGGALERLAQTFSLGDPRARSLVELCARRRSPGPLAPQEWLRAEDVPEFERHNLRLFYAQWLSQQRLYDEALEQLAGLTSSDVIDPAALWFVESVAHHQLLHKEEGLAAIAKLLDDIHDGRKRYQSLAALMQDDLSKLEDESLNHIARRMDDIRRRLELGRAGKTVRKLEDDVIASLDKMIEELEKQQQQQQQQQSSPSGGRRPAQAMPDSRIARMNAPGDVNRRNLGKTSGWGDLPPKEREEALQQIGKDFPPHYRDAIEQYFRKLAAESE